MKEVSRLFYLQTSEITKALSESNVMCFFKVAIMVSDIYVCWLSAGAIGCYNAGHLQVFKRLKPY